MIESMDQSNLHTDAQPPVKKTYRKPEYRFESVFETRALSCGKMHSTQSGCHFNRKSS
jgi:hypothetical protein